MKCAINPFIIKSFIIVFLTLNYQTVLAQPSNTNVSNGVLFDGEPYLAINPTNNQNLVAAWMGLKFSGGQFLIAIKTRASFDGGNSWSIVNSLPHFGAGYGSADVSMAFNKNGLLYITYIDYKQSPDSGGIYVARSSDGGLNWDTPSKAFDMYDVANKRPIDRPWLVVDNSSSVNSGTLYITTKPAPWIAPPNRNYFKVSTDSGHTWSAIANVDGGNYLIGNVIAAPMAAPAVTNNGFFCTVYPSYVTTQNPFPAYYLAKSFNKGQTFNYTTVFSGIPATNDTNLKNGYYLMADPVDSNKLIFLTPNAQNGDADIMALHSNDGGQTWNGPVRVNDDGISNGKEQDMVWGNYNDSGNVVVTWRDRRNATSSGFWNAGYDFYYATSSDNGQSFSANKKLSSQFIAFDSIIVQNGNDFMSSVYKDDTLYSIWGDTRNNKMNIYFAKTIASTNTTFIISQLDGNIAPWNIYPNPVKNELTVVVTEEMLGKDIFIYDEQGKSLFSSRVNNINFKIDTTKYPVGVYFIKSGNAIKRFIIK